VRIATSRQGGVSSIRWLCESVILIMVKVSCRFLGGQGSGPERSFPGMEAHLLMQGWGGIRGAFLLTAVMGPEPRAAA